MTDAHVGLAGQLARLPQRQVLSDDVYETVKGLIMDSVVEPGTRLNIDALTRELGISQTPIRESLARLESDGLVIKEPLRGYRVSSRLTRDEFDDLFEYRLLIEPWAAGRAAERAGADELARLKAEMGEAGFTTLERRWARPTCDVNGLTSGYQGPGAKTIIPSRASAKVSMRLVPNMDPMRIQATF